MKEKNFATEGTEREAEAGGAGGNGAAPFTLAHGFLIGIGLCEHCGEGLGGGGEVGIYANLEKLALM
jgi:hypothetical protein